MSSRDLVKLFARAISVAEEFGRASAAFECELYKAHTLVPGTTPEAYLAEMRKDHQEAQQFFLDELKKILPDE